LKQTIPVKITKALLLFNVYSGRKRDWKTSSCLPHTCLFLAFPLENNGVPIENVSC